MNIVEYAIIVMASNVHGARDDVRKYAKLHVESEDSPFYEEEDREKFLRLIEQDIACDPQIIPHDVIFIRGSE